MSNENLNSGLMPPIISREDVFGVQRLSFGITITSISNLVDVSTITTPDVKFLIDDDVVYLTGRTNSLEDGEYVVSNVDSLLKTFDITFAGGLTDTDLEGVFNSKGYPINQSYDTPIDIQETFEKEIIKSTFGTQVQKKSVVLLGNKNVNTSFGHQIGLNDAMILSAMFFQNGYDFQPTIVDGSIVSVTSVGSIVSIELTDVGTLVNDEIIVISRRTNSLEDGRYVVSNLVGNTFDITFEDGFDVDLEGVLTTELNIHEACIEKYGECGKQLIDSSFTIYLSKMFSKKICGEGEGEIATGMVPISLNYDFLNSTYSITMEGKDLDNTSGNLPIGDEGYIQPINSDGYMRKNSPVVLDANGVEQEAFELTLDVTFETSVEQQARKSGNLNVAVVDGVSVKGSWAMLFGTKDKADNYSNTIYNNRDKSDNSKLMSVGVKHTDGSEIFISGDAVFMNEVVTKAPKGWILRLDYEFLRSDLTDEIKISVKNGYNESMKSLFRTEK